MCGADIEKIEADTTLQDVVDRFIEGHARIKRSHTNSDKEEDEAGENKKVIYEDVSMERGAFLVQQAMRVSLASFFAIVYGLRICELEIMWVLMLCYLVLNS